MDAEERQHLNPRYQPETVSTASLQAFEDPQGGLPLDSPAVKTREQQRRGRPASVHHMEPGPDGKPMSPGA